MMFELETLRRHLMHIISIPIAIVAGLALLVLCFPIVARAVRSRKRPQFSLGRYLLMMLSCAVLLFAGVRWLRVDRYLAMASPWMAQQYNFHGMIAIGYSPATRYAPLPEEQELMVVNYALRSLPAGRDRISALKILCELRPNDAYDVLLQHAREDSDAETRAIELRLIGLFRRVDTVDFLMECLRDKHPEVRAAAADALGIIHRPAYRVPIGSSFFGIIGPPVIDSDPPISLEKLSKDFSPTGKRGDLYAGAEPIVLAGEVRDALENTMLRGVTSTEREAAARALLKWPPEKYRLRVMEWGVWIDDSGEMKLLKSVLDEIPAFVHRTGNSVSSLDDRINHVIFFTKPVIQVTTDAPMAVELEVQFRRGRPWFAYPLPDDFGVMASMLRSNGGNAPVQRQFLSSLDNAELAPLENLREGFPWLAPKHRLCGDFSGGPRAIADRSEVHNDILNMGLHWQSLIVSPQQLSWMQPPNAGADAKFKWWSDLRSVPCSWVSSRGESERFLYYDGPTLAHTPLRITRNANSLSFVHQAMFPKPPNDDQHDASEWTIFEAMPVPPGAAGKPRRGMFVNCFSENYFKTGTRSPLERNTFLLTLPDRDETTTMPQFKQNSAEQCVEEFVGLLTEQGLIREEARGMADCWKDAFFRRPGNRFIYLLRPDEYYEMCPIMIQPAPPEMVRVGVVLTEF